MDSGRRVRSGFLGRASLGVRVALFATVLALGSLCVLGYVQITSLSGELTRAAQEQGITGAMSTARAIAGLSASVVAVVPSSPRGVDGVVVFDRNGRVLAGSGSTQATLRGLAADARGVARRGRMRLDFRVPEGGSRSRSVGGLTPWSSKHTLQITILPREGGAIALASHMVWATDRLHSTAVSSALNLGGGAAFLCFALMLVIGRLVTRPLARLAAEVSHLGEGNLDAALSPQASPELRHLAEDISEMRDDLLQAVRDSATDPLTGVANHRGFHEGLQAAVETARRDGSSVALIAIDLDNLKLLNDRFGHQVGDRVIAGSPRRSRAPAVPAICAGGWAATSSRSSARASTAPPAKRSPSASRPPRAPCRSSSSPGPARRARAS